MAYSACFREATIIEQSAGHAAHILLSAGRPLIFTGAGVSAESGIPTFRGSGGLWGSYRAEDLATPEGFARDPRLCWEWYGWRRDLIKQCQPNPAHRAIALWMLRRPETTLVTQNVDGLHDRTRLEQADSGAGASPSATLCLHGSIFRVRCSRCKESWEHHDSIDATSLDTLPHCQRCSGLLRPDVVWFGEMLPEREMALASEAAARSDVVLVIGTQGSVYPAAGLVTLAHRSGARVVVVDPGETAFDGIAAIKLAGTAGELVPLLLGGPVSADLPPELAEFVRLFEQGLFWESHEALERAWRETRSEFYHGLILLASAFVHRDRDNRHGIRAQLDKAEPLLRRFRPSHQGVDVERLLRMAGELRSRL